MSELLNYLSIYLSDYDDKQHQLDARLIRLYAILCRQSGKFALRRGGGYPPRSFDVFYKFSIKFRKYPPVT